MTTEATEKKVEAAPEAAPEVTVEATFANPALEQIPPISPEIDNACQTEHCLTAQANAGSFNNRRSDATSLAAADGTVDFRPGTLNAAYEKYGKKLPVGGGDNLNATTAEARTEARLDAPVVAPGTNLTQAEMARMIRTRNYENAARTDATINGPAGHPERGIESRVGRSLDQPGDLARERATFEANLATMTPAQRAKAEEGLKNLTERNTSGALSDAQTAGVLASLNDMMDPKNAAILAAKGISTEQNLDNVASAVSNLGNPAQIQQGRNSSCALDGPLKELAASNPAAAADIIRQMSLNTETAANGNTLITLPDGRKIQTDASFVKHDNESIEAKTNPDNTRDIFNRSMTLALGNAVSQTEYNAFYVDRNGTRPGDTGERMISMNDPQGFNSRNYLTYGNHAELAMFTSGANFDENRDGRLDAGELAKQQAKKDEVVTDPLMTNSASINLQGMFNLGEQAYNGARVGTRPGLSTTGDVRNVAAYDALLARNGGMAVTSLDSRHALFQAYGQNAGYGGGHTVFNFGEFNVNGKPTYLMGTWGKLGMVQKEDLVNSMAPREQHVGVRAENYDTPAAQGDGAWQRDGAGGTGPGARQNDGSGQKTDPQNITNPDDRRRAEDDQRLQAQRDKDAKDRAELEAKKTLDEKDRERLAEIKKRQDEEAKRQKKYFTPRAG